MTEDFNSVSKTLKSKVYSGFTLLELLLVIAIIGVLAGLFISTFPNSQRQARDTQRKSDIKQYQTAMELFANKNNGNFFADGGTHNITSHTGATELNLSITPDDPLGGTNHYQLYSTTTAYVLFATLEVKPSPTTTNYFVVCSTGVSKLVTTAPSSSTCP